MEMNIFDFLADMEHDIAKIYKRIQHLSPFNKSNETFQYMIDHSEGHARTIEQLRIKHVKPPFRQKIFVDLHKELQRSLLLEVDSKLPLRETLFKIARTEEQIGKVYDILAGHYEKTAEFYTNVAKEIKHIAEEEYHHRDMIEKEVNNY